LIIFESEEENTLNGVFTLDIVLPPSTVEYFLLDSYYWTN